MGRWRRVRTRSICDCRTIGDVDLLYTLAHRRSSTWSTASCDETASTTVGRLTRTMLSYWPQRDLGRPKAVVHTHHSIAASAEATSKALSVDPLTDRWLACLPVAHIGGLSVILRSLATGTPLEVHDGFDADRVRTAALERGVTLVSLVTRALNQVPAELFRTVLIGGAAPPDDLPDNVIPTYGMTETGSGVVYGSRVLDGCELRILDDDRNPIDAYEVTGHIAVRGPMLFRGYRDRSGEVTAPFFDGGWFDTGDLGHWRPDGSVGVEGRDGEVIVTGGEKVWPAPVEALLSRGPTSPRLRSSVDRIPTGVTKWLPSWCRPRGHASTVGVVAGHRCRAVSGVVRAETRGVSLHSPAPHVARQASPRRIVAGVSCGRCEL